MPLVLQLTLIEVGAGVNVLIIRGQIVEEFRGYVNTSRCEAESTGGVTHLAGTEHCQ